MPSSQSPASATSSRRGSSSHRRRARAPPRRLARPGRLRRRNRSRWWRLEHHRGGPGALGEVTPAPTTAATTTSPSLSATPSSAGDAGLQVTVVVMCKKGEGVSEDQWHTVLSGIRIEGLKAGTFEEDDS